MSFDSAMTQDLEIRRSVPADPAVVDEDNLPVYAADTVIATVIGLIQPVTIREQFELADTGPVVIDSRAFLRPTDVRTADRIRRVDTNEVFEVRAVRDSAGQGHHYQLDLHRVSE